MERHTYTLNFTGTMYIEAYSQDEAYEEMRQMLSDVASDFEIEVRD